MELEFDKEIDAILRKARPNKGVLVGDDPPEPKEPRDQKPHLDADAIAAFAENALPEKARLLYIEHFADCDRCRGLLSRAVQMNVEADAAEKSAATTVLEPATETVIPWYESIFRTPNLALGMGALVLVFGGILGYLVLQDQKGGSNAIVTQIAEPEQERGGPYLSERNSEGIPTPTELPMVSANTASNTASADPAVAGAPPANAAMAARPDSAAKPADDARSGQFQIDGASGSENTFIIDGQETTDVLKDKKAAAAPPVLSQSQTDSNINSQSAELLPKGLNMSSVLKTAPATDAATECNEKKADAKTLKEEDKDRGVMAKRKQAEDRGGSRDAPPPAAKVGPARSGPLQNQANNQSNVYQMSVTRIVGGKTFSNRNGAWYDSAYHGQATMDLRRGTNEYKKLDSGLRKIADTLGGTVVLMWKSKAYRIQ